MSNNNYQEDFLFGNEKYQDLLDAHFYPHISGGQQTKRFDSESVHDKTCQRKLKVDLEIQLNDGFWHFVEEKVVRWPENNRPHKAFYYETESCSRSGLITPGWMQDSETEYLMYAFEILDCGLDIYLSAFQKLKTKFWEELNKNPYCFKCHRNRGKNESQGRIVPISFTTNATYTKRFLLHLDGRCEQVPFNTIFLPNGLKASA